MCIPPRGHAPIGRAICAHILTGPRRTYGAQNASLMGICISLSFVDVTDERRHGASSNDVGAISMPRRNQPAISSCQCAPSLAQIMARGMRDGRLPTSRNSSPRRAEVNIRRRRGHGDDYVRRGGRVAEEPRLSIIRSLIP